MPQKTSSLPCGLVAMLSLPVRQFWSLACLGMVSVACTAVRAEGKSEVSPPAISPATPTVEVKPGTPPTTVGPDGKPVDPTAKPGDPAKPAESATKVIRRADYLKTPGSSDKVDAPLGADGQVEFNFQSTPWPPVLDWLAEVSGKSLDWQELPGDYLNLHTQRRYTPEEARDLLNWHLLARGYTLLLHDEVFTVVSVKGLNPGIVPRVSIQELATRMPNEFVKISLPLDWLIAEDAATQLAPMLSPHGKLSALKSVNRIEAMDAVANLRDIVSLLEDEQSNQTRERALVREFKLVHVRADEVVLSLMAILGIEKKAVASSGGDMNGMMQQMQMQMQQQMQQMQQPGGSGGAAAQKPSEPKLVVNSRENSILAHAPPDKMEIIQQTVKALDVAGGTDGQILRNLDRMRVYRLKTLNPGPLAEILSDVGDLSPGARIRIDKDNNSIVLFGSLADHVTVQSLVEKLDGSPRNFEVITLRRLRADEVAGSILFMLSPEEKKEPQRSRWSYYDSFSSNEDTTRKEERPFRIDADVEQNRLLVWANTVELQEVQGLLIKMGEIPSDQTNPQSTRTLEFASPEEADRVLQQLQQLWPNVSPNQLQVPAAVPPTTNPPSSPAPNAPEPMKDSAQRAQRTPAKFSQLETVLVEEADDIPATPPARRHPLAGDESLPDAPRVSDSAVASSGAPPIAVHRLADGRMVIGSADTRALDQLEQLVRDLRPKTPDFHVFHLKNSNTWAHRLEMNLKDFFETEEDDKTILDWYGDVVSTKDKTPSRLSKRRKLKIISDAESRTILVQNATAEQLVMIEKLIEVYDLPESNDPRAIRVTKIFGLKHSQASVIADTVKSVYRDLLSANDASLQSKGDDKQPPAAQSPSTSYIFGRSNTDSTKKDEPKEQPIRFKGLLSIGVDEVSNSLVVSSASGLMDDIALLIETLDEAAKPTTKFEVMQLNSSLDAATAHEKISSLLGAGKKTKIKVSSSGEKGK